MFARFSSGPTHSRTPIPSGGRFVSDRSGNVVIARLDRAALRAVAEAGGGSYTELGSAPPDAELWAAPGEAGFSRRDDALGERWKDAGPWLVLLLLPLALAGFRRGLFFVLPIVTLGTAVLPQPAQAGWWDDLWLRNDQQAWRALQDGDPGTAAAVAEDPAPDAQGLTEGVHGGKRLVGDRGPEIDDFYPRPV